MSSNAPAGVISTAALEKNNAMCKEALSIFVSIYGSEAGNLALKFKATGGIYIGGGIAPKIVEKMKKPNFINAFLNKGRMKRLLQQIPVQVILNDRTAILGAAAYAMQRLQTLAK